MLNFSIMTPDEEHIDEVCEDIAYQVKNGIATMPLFMMPLTPKAIPPLGDPEQGIAPGTAWEDLPADWVCPVCGLEKDAFEAAE